MFIPITIEGGRFMESLSQREKQILAYMKGEIQKKGYPPTVREMCSALGIRSTSTAHKELAALENKGFIRKDPAKPRAIEILDGSAPPEKEERIDVVDIPVVGQIAAGMPILAEQNIEDSFPVPSRYLNNGTYFMLTVKGDSMIDAGIFNGDYILVRQQNTANNGDIVAAMTGEYESEATVKTFYKEKDHIRLQPENPTMEPILVKDVQILGLVKGVFRYFS